MTAKQWKDNNPNLSSNIRDYADLIQLIILNNLENTNSELIKLGVSQTERLIKLNNSARRQIELLKNNKNIEQLRLLESSLTKINVEGENNE